MCIAIPSKIVEIDGDIGIIDVDGVRKEIGLHLIESPKTGDYIIVHAGFAINRIDENEALETLSVFKEIAEGS
ncbi:MAG: HypC/HybG/HupF family hydrogenase formation chaperone [Deltaproteobacteria bacterium]|nr:HypC/HybG/HupF family hydrogenase formation chaperone [Deltaproteobacteria bacterium]